MLTDVKAYRATATGTLYADRTRVKAIAITGSAGAGSVIFRDGGAGGTTLLQLDTLANQSRDVLLPGEGILFQNDVHVTISGLGAVVAFCG